MKTIEIKLFKFSELSEQAKSKAIEQRRESMYRDSDIPYWVIDNCYLFEPLDEELTNLFGEEYNKMTTPMLGNTRKVYFSLDRDRYLNCEDGIIVNNEEMFLTWLRIPKYLQEKINYTFRTVRGSNSDTIIEFYPYGEHELDDEELDILDTAYELFNDHMDRVMDRIVADYDYYFSDEYIAEDIEANGYDFTENGTIY
jgi:hypothetical protein